MKIAVLGGGYTGLTAAYYLSKQNHEVVLIEKAHMLGGLAVGMKEDGWEWPLERAYHHLFASDRDIQSFAKEIGFENITFTTPRTDSLYKDPDTGKHVILAVDSPIDFMRFPYLTLGEKIRAALFLAILKFGPMLPVYEKYTAKSFIEIFMGRGMWNKFFEQLFRKKFGKYADKVLSSFLWARINKRTKSLGYVTGGFQTFVDHISKLLSEKGVHTYTGAEIIKIERKKKKYSILLRRDGRENREEVDYIVSTLPSALLPKIAASLLPETYLRKFSRLEFLSALVVILETEKPIIEDTYWLNICDPDIPLMFVGQHTNFIDKAHYNNHHIAYVGYYLEADDPLIQMSEVTLVDHIVSELEKLAQNPIKILKAHVFKAPYAQPLFTEEFLLNKPEYRTPDPHFFVANLDMTYPYDRGTNYAVKLGREVAEKLGKVIESDNKKG